MTATMQTFLKNIRSNPRFLYSAIAGFSTADTMEFFENLGVRLKTERGNRVFPVSDRAADIVDALSAFAKGAGARYQKGRVREDPIRGRGRGSCCIGRWGNHRLY